MNMDYDKVKQIAKQAHECEFAASVMGNKCVWDDYMSLRSTLLAIDDPVLKYDMNHFGIRFEITDTMTSEEAWKEYAKREDFNARNNGGEWDGMVTWDGYQI